VSGPNGTGPLAGRVVVVTGGARGQGAAQVRLLAEHDAVVIAVDVLDDDGRALAEELSGRGLAVTYRHLDVASPAQWSELADEIARTHGAVHGLVNNAGTTWRARLGEVEPADWDRVLAVNATGPMLGIQALLPLMGRGASIVDVGSIAALTGHYPVAYTAGKWALRGLSKAACVELGPRGIPPSTGISAPVMNEAASESRNARPAGRPRRRCRSGRAGMTAHGGVKSISDALR
jgi:3alpha(or 20beta)-hydroxysteroid dehydrogenase